MRWKTTLYEIIWYLPYVGIASVILTFFLNMSLPVRCIGATFALIMMLAPLEYLFIKMHYPRVDLLAD